MRNYKLIKNLAGVEIAIFYDADGCRVSIPFDPANTDYQEYLKWVAEGGVPLPPDSQE
jgi:hypothetical protein